MNRDLRTMTSHQPLAADQVKVNDAADSESGHEPGVIISATLSERVRRPWAMACTTR